MRTEKFPFRLSSRPQGLLSFQGLRHSNCHGGSRNPPPLPRRDEGRGHSTKSFPTSPTELCLNTPLESRITLNNTPSANYSCLPLSYLLTSQILLVLPPSLSYSFAYRHKHPFSHSSTNGVLGCGNPYFAMSRLLQILRGMFATLFFTFHLLVRLRIRYTALLTCLVFEYNFSPPYSSVFEPPSLPTLQKLHG